MTDLGASIGGSIKASDMAAGVKDAGNAVRQTAKKQYQDKVGSKIGSAMQSVDRAVFDSGKKADKDRSDKKSQDKADSKNRSTLAKAGSEGISKFKKENAVALAGMNAGEQKQALSAARNTAMSNKGTAMGLSPAETKKLIENKSSITNARTLGGLAQEAWQKKGTLGSSLDKKDVNTKISGSEMRSAMSNANDADKIKLQEGVEEGKLQVRVTSADRSSHNMDQAKESLKDMKFGAAAKSFAKAVGQGAKAATVDKAANSVSRAGSAIKSGAKAAYHIPVESSEHKDARVQLEESGEISKQAAGTRWAASNTDKGLIKDKAAEIKQAATPDTDKPMNKSTERFMAKLGGAEDFAEKKKVQSAVNSVGSDKPLSTISEGDEGED
jgi:hypothetical protein